MFYTSIWNMTETFFVVNYVLLPNHSVAITARLAGILSG